MSSGIPTAFEDSELVIGLVGATGTDLDEVTRALEMRLPSYRYEPVRLRVSKEVIPALVNVDVPSGSHFDRTMALMDAGNQARMRSGDNSVLALGIAAAIAARRSTDNQSRLNPAPRRAVVVHSLKHPDEVVRLRQIYPHGFYLIGVHADPERRCERLTKDHGFTVEEAKRVMRRDEDERIPNGQRTTDTFHLSDFFVHLDDSRDRLPNEISRILDLLFGAPYQTPSFDEYAMFMAFSAALRSADLSRQVGAVVARKNEILSTGANDCPRCGGGLYWPVLNAKHEWVDEPDGRDHVRGFDSNRRAQADLAHKMAEAIRGEEWGQGLDMTSLKTTLMKSGIKDLTEYGRVVHAEMEALLACARRHESTQDAEMFCTTFPCHNCAKHIIAAGIKRVVYIEPYAKSRAPELHSDSAVFGLSDPSSAEKRVVFEPFVGVGPRRFFDLFSMANGAGRPMERKTPEGQTVQWQRHDATLRLQMIPVSYLDREFEAGEKFKDLRKHWETQDGAAD